MAAEGRTVPGVGDWDGLPHQALCGANPLMVKHDLQGSMHLLSARLILGSINRAAQCCHLAWGPTSPEQAPLVRLSACRWGALGGGGHKRQQGMGSAGLPSRSCTQGS